MEEREHVVEGTGSCSDKDGPGKGLEEETADARSSASYIAKAPSVLVVESDGSREEIAKLSPNSLGNMRSLLPSEMLRSGRKEEGK